MLTEHGGVFLRVRRIVIPVHQGDIFRNQAPEFLRDLHPGIVVFPAGEELEEHVAPHHRPEMTAIADGKHPIQVIHHDAEMVLRPVSVLVHTAAQHMRLVHSDQNLPGRKALPAGPDHLFDQRIGFLLPAEKDIRRVMHVPVSRPAEDGSQVRQCLDAGDKFDSKKPRIPVKVLELLRRKAPAHVAEIGLPRNLIGILRVQHHRCIAHQRDLPQEGFDGLRLFHRVPRIVLHVGQRAEAGSLLRPLRVPGAEFLRQDAEGPAELRAGGKTDGGSPGRPVRLDEKPLRRMGNLYGHGDRLTVRTVIRFAGLFLQLGSGAGQFLRFLLRLASPAE